MLDVLKAEEQKDLKAKNVCEQDRMQNTRGAIVLSRNIDDSTDTIIKLNTTIEDCEQKIQEIEVEMEKTKDAVDEAKPIRKREHDAWVQTNKDDKEAAATVMRARDVP